MRKYFVTGILALVSSGMGTMAAAAVPPVDQARTMEDGGDARVRLSDSGLRGLEHDRGVHAPGPILRSHLQHRILGNETKLQKHLYYSPYEATLFHNTNSSQQLVRKK